MFLQVMHSREDFSTSGNRTGVAAGRGTNLARVSLDGVNTLVAGKLAGGLTDSGSVELLLGT